MGSEYGGPIGNILTNKVTSSSLSLPCLKVLAHHITGGREGGGEATDYLSQLGYHFLSPLYFPSSLY